MLTLRIKEDQTNKCRDASLTQQYVGSIPDIRKGLAYF